MKYVFRDVWRLPCHDISTWCQVSGHLQNVLAVMFAHTHTIGENAVGNGMRVVTKIEK